MRNLLWIHFNLKPMTFKKCLLLKKFVNISLALFFWLCEGQVECVRFYVTLLCRGRWVHTEVGGAMISPTGWGISRRPGRDLNTKHLLLLSSLNTHTTAAGTHLKFRRKGWSWILSCARPWLYSSCAWPCMGVSNLSFYAVVASYKFKVLWQSRCDYIGFVFHLSK